MYNNILFSLNSGCNCHNHSDVCVYNENSLNRGMRVLDIHGNYSGGGVCQNCQVNYLTCSVNYLSSSTISTLINLTVLSGEHAVSHPFFLVMILVVKILHVCLLSIRLKL